jgi:hypothetical protein
VCDVVEVQLSLTGINCPGNGLSGFRVRINYSNSLLELATGPGGALATTSPAFADAFGGAVGANFNAEGYFVNVENATPIVFGPEGSTLVLGSIYFRVKEGPESGIIPLALSVLSAPPELDGALGVSLSPIAVDGVGVCAEEGEGGGFEGTPHSADQNGNGQISLSELLRVIQFYNLGAYHCSVGTEDGYAPGPGDQTCAPHAADYNPQDWDISLSELLRPIQIYNSTGYEVCEGGEDGYCLLTAG